MRFGFRRLMVSLAFSATAALSGAQLFGISYDTGEIYEINPSTAALSDVDNTGPVSGIADLVLANNGLVYGYTVGANAQLYSFNPASDWSSTLIGALGGSFYYEGGLANVNGTIYGANVGSTFSDNLFTLNLTTGAATLGARLNGGAGSFDFNGFDVNTNGTLVGIDRVSNALESINRTTGVVTQIGGALPTTIGEVGGLTTLNGQAFYCSSGPGGVLPGDNSLFAINETNGGVTGVGPFGDIINSPHGLSGLVAINTAPEPAGLLALAGLILFSRARRSHQLKTKQ